VKILVLGGTRFIGRHLVNECFRRGDDVTVLYRGRSSSPFAGLARHVISDRRAPTAQARAVLGEPWDAVIDTSAVDIDDVAPLTPLLTRTKQYILVSSCAVYRRSGADVLRENSPTITAAVTDPAQASATRKLRCERHLRRHASRTTQPLLIARLGLVVGRFDYQNRFAYWMQHAIRGGEALVPMDRAQPIQIVDVADVAVFLRAALEGGTTGIVNVAGPIVTAQALVESIVAVSAAQMTPCWVGEQFAQRHGVRPWTEVPFWLAQHSPERALLNVDSAKARAAGLTYRPLHDTLLECLDWQAISGSWSQQWLDPNREQTLLRSWWG
jgi:2'-hydroxyisoflavone reductase